MSTQVSAQDRAATSTTTPVATPPAPAAVAPTTEPTVGEVVVTAQRRDQALSRTPVAVAVVSRETLQKANIISEQDLQVATPGLTVRAQSNSNQLNYALRGNTTDPFANTRPGVLPYINEVQIGGPGGSSAFYDLQSVQVLKGPQGTLFGRSATGGAVLFTTAKPTDELGGYIDGLVGNYNAYKLEGAINVPIDDDHLMVRLSGFHQERDGFQHNLYSGGREGDINRSGLRGSLSANYGKLHNDLVIDYYQSNSQSTLGVIAGVNANVGGFPTALLYTGLNQPNTAAAIATLQAFTGAPLPAVTAFYNAYFSAPNHPPGGLASVLAAQNARGPYVVDSDAANTYNADNLIITNTTTFDLNENTKIRNIFGYTGLRTFLQLETDGTPYTISENGLPTEPKLGIYNFTAQLSDELQLVGKTLDSQLDYVTGIYYSYETYNQRQNPQFFDIFFGQPPQAHFDYDAENLTYAAYGQGTYHINDSGLAATVGLRYTSEQVKRITEATDTNYSLCATDPAVYSCDQSKTFGRVSWSFGLQDQLNRETLFYVVSRQAFKSGGFNGSVAPKNGLADVAGDAYQAERVTDVELGTKYSGRTFGMPASANMALYYNWVSDSQRVANTFVAGSPASVTTNVPKGTTYGAELDGQIRPIERLTLGGTFNYTHASFSDTPAEVNGQLQIFDQVPDTPSLSGSVFSEYTVPVANGLSATLHGDLYAQDRSFTSPRSADGEGTTVHGYTLANFRLALDSDKGWSLTANLKNAFNRVYYVGGLAGAESYQINLLVPGEPRTYTLEARYRF